MIKKVSGAYAQLIKEMPFFWALPAFIWQIFFFYIPLFFLIVISFVHSTDWSSWNQITLEHYVGFMRPMFSAIMLRSLVLAVVNAVICVALAFPIAYYLSLRAIKWKNLLLFFLILPFWTNFLVQVYAWFFVLERYGVVNSLLLYFGIIQEPIQLLYTPFAVYLVMLYCYIPFAVMPIYTILEKFDARLVEASSDLGATYWQTFWRITLPLAASGIRTSFFLVFITSFGEFVIPDLMGGGKQMYAGLLISHYFLVERNFNVGAAYTVLVGAVILVCAVIFNALFSAAFKNLRNK